jgi:lambda family phage portal protein
LAQDVLRRHFEAAAVGRRTQGWHRTATDANSAIGPSLQKLRDAARDLVRNNGYAEAGLNAIVDHAIGWGIRASAKHDAWKRWTETTDIDADGRHDLAGLEKLVTRTMAEAGEVLVRRRWRRLEDGLALPLQLQILEPDFLDTSRDATALPNGGQIIQGVEFDAIGRRAAYWLYRTHPGSSYSTTSRVFGGASSRVPASDILHVYDCKRSGQVRGYSWYAPSLLRFKDFDEFEDATLMKQKVAALLAVITSDVDGETAALGTSDDAEDPAIDALEPGMILNLKPGRDVHVVNPPTTADYAPFTAGQLRAIATGIGVAYEDLTGDFSQVSFSSARMARLRRWERVYHTRWIVLVPQFLNPLWRWAMEAAAIAGLPVIPTTEWTAPPMPMIEPDKEGLAIQRNIRNGITTPSEEIRARGYNVTEFLDELQADFEELDRRKIVLDCDPRKMTQSGQVQGSPILPGTAKESEP